MHKKAKVDIAVEAFFLKEGDIFVAYAPALNLATQGDSLQEANLAFDEALKIFIDEVMEMGTLEEVLRECGWVKIRKKWTPQNTSRF